MLFGDKLGKFDLIQQSHNWFHHAGEVPYSGLLEHIFPVFWPKWEKRQNEITAAINYYINSRAMQQKGFSARFRGHNLFRLRLARTPHIAKPTQN